MLRFLHIRSIRTVSLLAMTVLVLVLSFPLLYSGIRIMDSLVDQYGMELLVSELHAQIAQVDRRYATLKRVGLEDSQDHQREIMTAALKSFADYRYKETGTLFVIRFNKNILLSSDFKNSSSDDFSSFFTWLQDGISPMTYQVNGVTKRAVVQYYQPWESFVGLSMEAEELFAPRNLFVRINLGVLGLVLTVAAIFIWWLQHNIVSSLINLTRFASRVRGGDYQLQPKGSFILELQVLKDDILQMVAALREKMRESEEQVVRIRENEARYRAIFNAPSDAIVIHDPKTGVLLEVNNGAAKLFGYSIDEMKSFTVADISPGESPYGMEEAREKIDRAIRHGSVRFEWIGKKRDGTLFWIDVALQYTHFGDQDYVIAVVRDIDERKQAELSLARDKEQLAVTLRSIADGVITTNLDGEVVLLNRVAEELTGWRQDEAAGRPLPEIFHIVDEESGQPGADPAKQVLQTGNIIELSNHIMLLSRNGEQHNIADSAAPIYDPEHRVIGVVVVFRDVTEKNRMEQELLKVKKLESIGVLAGGIAHDFNNILAAILGNVSLARARLQAEDSVCERVDSLLENAENAGGQARNLTNQLLTFSKGGDPVKQTASISEILRESAAFVLHGSSVDCSFDFAEDLWFADVDSGQISQVVQNIILNARQAMPDGGSVQVTAENCKDCSGETDVVNGGCVRVVISDNGPGMSSEVLEKAFDPYYSTKPSGSGLGLAICHSVLDKHKGSIRVTSTPGKGTAFTLLLPVSQKSQVCSAPKEETMASGQSRILLMDDEAMIRDLGAEMLSFLGHQVVTVADGQEAIDCYREAMSSSEPFDVVIMDLTIPGGMGGKEAAARLLKVDSDARIIVSSGYSNDPVVADYQQYGFAATMSKPYDIEKMRSVLQEVCSS